MDVRLAHPGRKERTDRQPVRGNHPLNVRQKCCQNNFGTDMAVGREIIAELVGCARSRGRLSARLSRHSRTAITFGTISGVQESALQLSGAIQPECVADAECLRHRLPRVVGGRRQTGCPQSASGSMKFLPCHFANRHWGNVVLSIVTGELPTRPPEVELALNPGVQGQFRRSARQRICMP